MSTDRVSLAIVDGVAELRLTRADRHNAIDAAMADQLAGAVTDIANEPSVRAVLIAADGPSFTVGGDLGFLASADLAATLGTMVPQYHDTLETLALLPTPIVVAVQGAAAGGGLGLLWAGDIVIAADDAVFATGFVGVGVSGDGGSSWHLPRLVGMRRARELLIGGRTLTADEALAWGLVTRLVPRAELDAAARDEAARLAAGPATAIAEIRSLLLHSTTSTYAEQLAAETEAMARCSATTDAAEGMAVFAARRRPAFGARSPEPIQRTARPS